MCVVCSFGVFSCRGPHRVAPESLMLAISTESQGSIAHWTRETTVNFWQRNVFITLHCMFES